MEKEIIDKIKEKKEFSDLPESIIKKAAELVKGDVKEAREILRKYFGVFVTNKLVKGKLSAEEMLKKHISTKNRDYDLVYSRILGGDAGSVIDLGCGVNSFSYSFLEKTIKKDLVYVGIEATGQFVKVANDFFRNRGFEKAHVFHKDLFDLSFILKTLKQTEEFKPRIVFMFNIVDALEFFERNSSFNFIKQISENSEKIVLSFPTQSLSGKSSFKVKRYWITNFIEENFKVLDDFENNGERFIIFKKKD